MIKIVLISIGIFLLLIVIYALIEPHFQTVRTFNIKNSKIPSDFNNFKIVFLADIHYGRTLKETRLKRLVHKTNSFKPDLILLGGDYVTQNKYIKSCFEILKGLKSKHGVYAVTGNHDVIEGLEETLEGMKKANIVSANNDSFWIERKNKILVGGVGDLNTQEQILENTISKASDDDFVILLTHNPKFIYEIYEDHHIDLILAGHTHGGQFSPAKHIGKITPEKIDRVTGLKYLSGRQKRYEKDVIVSNGIGTAKFPFRLLAVPEIIIINLKCE